VRLVVKAVGAGRSFMDPAERSMRAEVGDRIVIRGHHVGEPARDGEVLEVLGQDGAPPYLVRCGRIQDT
jgi:hypothetical protein